MIIRTAAALLFDLDGTLISSIAATERVWGGWAAQQGLDVPAFFETMHGRRAVDLIGALGLPGVDPAGEAAKIAAAELIDLEGIAPIAGARRFVDALPRERWAVVTSAPRELALARIAAAGMPAPSVLVAAEESPRGKPAPDAFLLAAERLGIAAEACVVFEDAPAGIEAGEAAGAFVIVVDALGSAHTRAGTRPTIASYDEIVLSVQPDSLTLRLHEGLAEAPAG